MKRIVLLLVCVTALGRVAAQTYIDRVIESSHIAGAYASMINFATEPDISAAKLNIDNGLSDDDTLRVLKFPLRHEFKLEGKTWKPVVEATLARLKLESTLPLSNGETIEGEWSTYSAAFGGGIDIPISKYWNLLPAIDLGYAYIKNEAAYGPEGEAYLKPILAGKLFDWNAQAWTLSAHLALLYQQLFGKLKIDGRFSGTASHIESFDSTSALQEFNESIGTFTLKADATHPLGFSILHYPIFGVAHLGHSTLVSDSEVNLGFRHLNEAGFSFEADISRHSLPVRSLSLGAMVLWGDHVNGWKILTSYHF